MPASKKKNKTTRTCHQNSSKAAAYMTRKRLSAKQKQLDDAVRWCKTKNKRGWAAIHSEKLPLIKSLSTVNKRLDGRYSLEKNILMTVAEENSLVRYLIKKPKQMFPGNE